jgi:hypothetical protein
MLDCAYYSYYLEDFGAAKCFGAMWTLQSLVTLNVAVKRIERQLLPAYVAQHLGFRRLAVRYRMILQEAG